MRANHVQGRPTPRQATRRHAPAGAALFALLGLLAAGCGSEEKQQPAAAAESQELFLQPVGAAEPDPFTQSTSTGESAPLQAPVPNTTGRGIRTVVGSTPGLYGGAHRFGSCDVEQQIRSLTAEKSKGKALAFAQASGIEPNGIPEYLRGLTPVVLRADVRVTNHGFRDGRANGFQSVLQAGTAVLVDRYGMPRVRCACGNPLQPPRAPKGEPVTQGKPWTGYHPNQVIVIEPTSQVIDKLVIANLADNTWIERRTGDDGAQDRAPQVMPPYNPEDGLPAHASGQLANGPADPCAARDTSAGAGARTVPPKSSGVPGPAATGCPPGSAPRQTRPIEPAPLPPPNPRPSRPQTDQLGELPSDASGEWPSTDPAAPADPYAQTDPLNPDAAAGDGTTTDPYAPTDPAAPADPYEPADPYAVPDEGLTSGEAVQLESA
ncbi:hypothetical protein DEJ50_04010 [Streptomyces venezuelae]|uniref:DUF6777 domain-containing protein n=1 Tax=Streptomyces venezuelae TaxID=54571 RepID=A0A5P2CXY4_STRVZ|nr:DUF6777 domain-containing protein [Streptomyces venezuelae]QES47130.1 hypothetical protein DEJ50_04010 [Streptomyces venezuelae]